MVERGQGVQLRNRFQYRGWSLFIRPGHWRSSTIGKQVTVFTAISTSAYQLAKGIIGRTGAAINYERPAKIVIYLLYFFSSPALYLFGQPIYLVIIVTILRTVEQHLAQVFVTFKITINDLSQLSHTQLLIFKDQLIYCC